MPSTYSHYRFGKEVLPLLPEAIQTLVEKHRSLYDMASTVPTSACTTSPCPSTP